MNQMNGDRSLADGGSLLPRRTRPLCAAVKTGKAWVRASSALGTGQADMVLALTQQQRLNSAMRTTTVP
jgi:hypothetical protein